MGTCCVHQYTTSYSGIEYVINLLERHAGYRQGSRSTSFHPEMSYPGLHLEIPSVWCHQEMKFLCDHLYNDVQFVCWESEMNWTHPDVSLEWSEKKKRVDEVERVGDIIHSSDTSLIINNTHHSPLSRHSSIPQYPSFHWHMFSCDHHWQRILLLYHLATLLLSFHSGM